MLKTRIKLFYLWTLLLIAIAGCGKPVYRWKITTYHIGGTQTHWITDGFESNTFTGVYTFQDIHRKYVVTTIENTTIQEL